MRATQSQLVVSSFAEGRLKLFGDEIFNNLSVAIVVTHVQVCHQNPLSTWDCPTCSMDCSAWMSTGHPTITDQACPTVHPIPLYHGTGGTGGTVHGSPLSHLRAPIFHCLSYPTVPWDRWDCPRESTVPPESPHIPLSVLSYCTMGQVGLSTGVHCPT